MPGINIRYLLAEVTGRKNRSILMLSGIALGVVFWLCLNALAGAYGQAAAAPLRELGADLTLQKSGGPIPDTFEGAILPCADDVIKGSAAAQVQDIPGVQKVASALLLWVFDSGMENANDFKMVAGIDPANEFGPGELKGGVTDGRFLSPDDQGKALVEEGYASTKGLEPGDTLSIAGHDYQIVGVVAVPSASLLGSTNVYIPLKEAQEIASSATQIAGFERGDVNLLFIKADPAQLASIQAQIAQIMPGVTVSTPTSFLALMGGLAASATQLAWLGSVIGLLAAIAMTLRTSASNVWERRRDIAIMKAVGWTAGDVFRPLVSENLLLGLAGGIVGLMVSYGFTLAMQGQVVAIPLPWELNPYPHFYLTSGAAKLLEVPLAVQLSWGAALSALALGMGIALVTTLLISRRLTAIKPSEVLRDE